ncbi:MAG: HAD family phosphatase [Alphaproteobacteria bacterium]|nr:HAD family phosphatase [Alphaproteobacteria bacterium]
MVVTTVIFDFGGVLFDASRRYLFEKVFSDEARMDFFFDKVCSRATWQIPANQGQPICEITKTLTAQFPAYAAEIDIYDKRWEEVLGEEIGGSVEILTNLHERGIPLYGITDWPEGKFGIAERRWPQLLELFNDIAVSSYEKVAKPDPRLYEILLARNDLKPEQCLFIDDLARNVHSAEELGLQGHHFQNPEKLRQDLMRRALL